MRKLQEVKEQNNSSEEEDDHDINRQNEELKVSSTIGRYHFEEIGTHSLSSLGRRIAENNG